MDEYIKKWIQKADNDLMVALMNLMSLIQILLQMRYAFTVSRLLKNI